VRGSGAAQPVFVGRAAETAAAEQAWADVLAGHRQLVVIGGEPGAGKSRLVAEVASALHHRGAVVLLGQCTPEPAGPYQPFVQCLEQLLGGTAEGALAGHLTDATAELLRLTPLVLRHLPDLGRAPDDDSDVRQRLFDAVGDLLDSVSRDRPVVCVLEDLHWAGAPTLQMLVHLAQRSGSSRLLVLATQRSTEPDRSDELTYAIADLYRLDGVRRLDLAGLTTDEVAEYLILDAGLAIRRAREYAAVLRDQTGGNPFFLRETLRDGAAGRGITTRGGGQPAPVSVRDTLQRRLTLLTPDAREALEVAAVVGDDGDVRTLVQVLDGKPTDVLAALDASTHFGLLDADELAHSRLAFPHMLTRQAVLDLLEPSRRVALHARVAEILEQDDVTSPGAVRRLAHHYARASPLGFGAKAAQFLVLSARAAERSLAFEDAAVWYAEAADLTDGAASQRHDLSLAAARCLVRAGDFAGARDLYRMLSDTPDPQVRLQAAIGFEDAGWRPGLPGDEACTLLMRALDGVGPNPTDHRYVIALAGLGRALSFTGDIQRARTTAEQSLDHARRLGDPSVLTYVLTAMFWQVMPPDAISRQQAMAEELSSLARARRDWEALATAGVWRSVIALLRAEPRTWEEGTADLDLAVRNSGQPFMTYIGGCLDYARAFLGGDFDRAEQLAEDLLELGRSFGPHDTEGPYGLQMFMVRRETGGLDAVRPMVEAGVEVGSTWEPGLLALYTELGMHERARPLLARLLTRVTQAPSTEALWGQRTAVLAFLVEAALALRDVHAARSLRPLLARFEGLQLLAGEFIAVFGAADGYLAALDDLLGDHASADRLFARAVEQNRAIGSAVHTATALAAWSASLAARGDGASRARARSLRAEARRLATSLGQVRVLRRLDAAADSDSPAGLTAREVDVLRLVAAGTSNRDIASRLRISENTAANHVRSILTKTGAANRTQVAMMAVARQWVDDVGHRGDG
jgi:DNA-binding CsgD family transcriptional regulator